MAKPIATNSNTGQYTGQYTTAAAPAWDGIEQIIDEVAELKELLKERAHINVAKDQENRICELEEAVGRLIKANEELEREKAKAQITASSSACPNTSHKKSSPTPAQEIMREKIEYENKYKQYEAYNRLQ